MNNINKPGVMDCSRADLLSTCLSFLRIYDDQMQLATTNAARQNAEDAFNDLENIYKRLQAHNSDTLAIRNEMRMLLKHNQKMEFVLTCNDN